MTELDKLRVELAERLLHAKRASLYDQLCIPASSSDEAVNVAIAGIKAADTCMNAEFMYAVEILASPQRREAYDRKLVIDLSKSAKNGSMNTDVRPDHQNNRLPSKIGKLFAVLVVPVLLCVVYAANKNYGGSAKQESASQNLVGSYIYHKSNTLRKCSRVAAVPTQEQKKIAHERIGAIDLATMEERLSEATKQGDLQIVSDILTIGVSEDVLNSVFDDVSVSHKNVFYGNGNDSLALLALFVRHGADLNDPTRVPALVHAAVSANIAAAEYLISQCADVNLGVTYPVPSDGSDNAFYKDEKNLMGSTPLDASIAGQSSDMMRLLLEHGANPNKPGMLGLSPLTRASIESLDKVKLLLEFGADIKVATSRSRPVGAAIAWDKPDIARYLIEHGADVSTVPNAPTLLAQANAKGFSDVATLLRGRGLTE
ncbi:ankyrin repeat domain-containing protein [Uliginosibacterium sp. TH139]|uniref:ankyrin repeat domain-containing protein n=1 Tax=Uliginosibacterium sp. TH139 TaxID=2067453 RepID=UPI000C7A8E35|nr:ankyrin repeat domain-containing protein [Uliginosibacterium sp. TH139]PLK49686.1 hypothetical protein C0V76_04445 [Uliginosibacterium sp. TH139]